MYTHSFLLSSALFTEFLTAISITEFPISQPIISIADIRDSNKIFSSELLSTG
jgi:hypothetical protein